MTGSPRRDRGRMAPSGHARRDRDLPMTTGAAPDVVSGEPHRLTASAVAAGLRVDPRHGLEADAIATRRAQSGSNELEAAPRPTVLDAVRRAVLEPFVILLFVAGGLAILLGEVRDGVLVL